MNSANVSVTMACEVSVNFVGRLHYSKNYLNVLHSLAILVLYLTRRLGYDDDGATVLYHVFTSLVYFCPLFGAIIADSFLGRFK